MRFFHATTALAATALAGHGSKAPTSKGPAMLITGCPNGYTDFVTGECKPFHLRIRDAASGDWRSHKVTDAYHVADHPHGPPFGGRGDRDDDDDDDDDDKRGKGAANWAGKGQFGHGKPGGPSHHCPNGVAFRATGECKPFRVHARDADSGAWKEHHVTGAYRIPDEKPGKGGFGGFGGFGGGQHSGPGGARGGPQRGAHGGPKGGAPGGFGGDYHEGGGQGGKMGGGPGKGGFFGGGQKGGPGGQKGGW